MAAFKLMETKANIFHLPHTYSLGHAIAADFDAVKDTLAWQFAIIFGQLDERGKQDAQVGDVALLSVDGRFVYFLVTKTTMYSKSTYIKLHSALICMREHMRNHNVSKVALPKLCCGNDGLNWSSVRKIIDEVFANEYNVEILICDYTPPRVANPPKCRIIEVNGNVFSSPPDYSLVHSTSADFAMSQGIGLQFKCKFGQVHELVRQNKHKGNVAVLRDKKRFIYNLITKERNHERCTYPALYYALLAMREHMLLNDITKLAMPTIGCGIDRLNWLHIKKMLEFVFANDPIEIITYFRELQHLKTVTLMDELLALSLK